MKTLFNILAAALFFGGVGFIILDATVLHLPSDTLGPILRFFVLGTILFTVLGAFKSPPNSC
jgi:hypothetical protein